MYNSLLRRVVCEAYSFGDVAYYLYVILMSQYVFQVHMEAERKAVQLQGDAASVPNLPLHEKITYRVGNKVNHDSKFIRSIEFPYLKCNPWTFLFVLMKYYIWFK